MTVRCLPRATLLATSIVTSMVTSCASAAIQSSIPFKRDSEVGGVGGSAVGVLAISLIAIVVVLVMRRRLRLDKPASADGNLLRVLESQRLGPQALLTVVEFDGTRYLIAQGQQGISCIASSTPRGPA